MGYDGGFHKVRMKLNNQDAVDNYEKKLRSSIYKIIGHDNFYKFEGLAIELPYLDNDWVQRRVLGRVIDDENIKNYETDDTHFTLITKDILCKYITELDKELKQNHSENLSTDIKLLKDLYNTFDWNNDTLVFSYSY